jgi:two-component system sensor histidine kinase UhpB
MMLGSLMAIWQARNSVAAEVLSSVNLARQMIDFAVTNIPVANRKGADWIKELHNSQHVRHLNFTLLDKDNQAKASFEHQSTERKGSAPQWFVDAVMSKAITASYDVLMADGSLQTILISADPMDEISEAWSESLAFFFTMSAMIFLIYLMINLVFQSVFTSVSTIMKGLKQVELGEFGHVLPPSNISEFDAISSEINAMSAALKKAQKDNQALAKHTIQIQETERQTMSRELHDEMGQSLTAIKAMAVTVKQPDVDVQPAANSIIDICNHLAVVVRSMMRTLHPLSLADLGLGATLKDLIGEWRRRYPELAIKLDYDEELESLDNKVAIHVYRIVQEGLTNVVRHASATEVQVKLVLIGKPDMPMVNVFIIDNGQGGKPDSKKGFGVLGMQERVESLGGKFKFTSTEGKGVEIHAWMPYMESEK